MKTVSSSSHTSKRLRNLLVVLLPLICGKLSAEETFHALIAQQMAYQNQEILPQIEETQFSLELTIPSLVTSLDYDLIPPPPFTLDPITPLLLEEEYMTQKRSPFRAKKTINFSKEIAKDELAGLIHECKKQHYYCACVVHGIGGGILKHKIPQYLVQHPDVIAMHQAPLEYGGKGAVLILINLPQSDEFRR
mgnify:CR=1 FL=1